MRMLQVCNVGRIAGGTAACAWTITRAFPDWRHDVAFLSALDGPTRAAFRGCHLHRWPRVTSAAVRTLRPDLVLLHNVAPDRCESPLSACTVQYAHSSGPRAAADLRVDCSEWLRRQCGEPSIVLLQGVTRPRPPAAGVDRGTGSPLRVGRLCTPIRAKWPAALTDFYATLAGEHPGIAWEFVGCPDDLRPTLRDACSGRARFHEASWEARSRLWSWDALLYHHPTLTESFGRTAAEAMRAGCVPIVDDRGGFREQIVPGTGWLCGDRAAFSEALGELRDAASWSRMSTAAAEHADAAFGLARFRRDLLKALRSGTC